MRIAVWTVFFWAPVSINIEKRCNHYRLIVACMLSGASRDRPVIVGWSTALRGHVIVRSSGNARRNWQPARACWQGPNHHAAYAKDVPFPLTLMQRSRLQQLMRARWFTYLCWAAWPADIRLGRAAARLLPPEWLRAACNSPRDLCSPRASSPRRGTLGGSCARRCARCLCP